MHKFPEQKIDSIRAEKDKAIEKMSQKFFSQIEYKSGGGGSGGDGGGDQQNL